ncbi:MAG: lactate utilization protein [Bacteroidales bacterium]|nr:lactate utilization protein [Bacteroidales bacterium]
MNSDGYKLFLKKASANIASGEAGSASERIEEPNYRFKNQSNVSTKLGSMLQKSIENLDEALLKFERYYSDKNNKLYWALDYQDLFRQLELIVAKNSVTSYCLVDSFENSVLEEFGLPFFFRDHNITTKDDADLQIFDVDMMLQDSGFMLFVGRDDKYLKKLNNNKINIFISTISRLGIDLSSAELFTQFKTGSDVARKGSQNFILFKGSQNCDNYLFIVDNQRSNVMANKRQRAILTCIECGRCREACPVTNIVGKEAYNNVFWGPVGHVVLPYMEDEYDQAFISYACTLCGRCEEVCPLSLPIKNMVLENRHKLLSNNSVPSNDRYRLMMFRHFLESRKMMNRNALLKKILFSFVSTSNVRHNRRLPVFSKSTFNSNITNAK